MKLDSSTTSDRSPARVGGRWTGLDRRRRGLVFVVAAAMLMATGAWVASLVIESPREAAANAAAPAPSLITVPVERRTVGEELITRGLVTATQTIEAITPGAGRGAERALISGHLPKPGQRITGGDVVVEVSGRPVIALQGDVPAYRSLAPGDVGPDVQQLNAALTAAGFSVDAKSKEYGDQTRDAVTALFRRAGYTSNGALPSSEVLFVSAFPASVVTVNAALGADVGGASVQITSGKLVVSADFPAAQAGLLQPGAKAVLSSEILGISVDATVQQADRQRDGQSGDGQSDPAGGDGAEDASSDEGGDAQSDAAQAGLYEIVPDQPLGSEWAGQDVKVRIVSATTEAAVLAVPVTAIVSNSSGETEVVVVAKGAKSITDADPRRVQVTVGAIGGGWAEVTPAKGEDLNEGDPIQLSAATAAGQP